MKLLPALLATAVALGSGACSLLISGEADQIHCSDEGQLGPPACDPGFSCQSSVCRADASPPSDDGEPEALGGAGGSRGSAATNGAGGAGGAGAASAATPRD